MLTKDFINLVELKIFPEGIKTLRNCKSNEEASSWKRNLCKNILSNLLEGEQNQNSDIEFDSLLEETKVELPISKQISVKI
jgi:hypothetical protein